MEEGIIKKKGPPTNTSGFAIGNISRTVILSNDPNVTSTPQDSARQVIEKADQIANTRSVEPIQVFSAPAV